MRRWNEPSCHEEQAQLERDGGFVIARRATRNRVVRYVDRVYLTRAEASLALADMLSIYPADSPWREHIIVTTWPAPRCASKGSKRGRPRKVQAEAAQ